MLAIARGMMAKPNILLLDEPSLGLAPAMINELFDVLADLRDEGITILLVDQMAVLALAIADRGYVIDSGRIVREDSAINLAGDPDVEAAYLGHAGAAQ
jgi:ABC-type branched-subunit amino acid transport system ATPase component